MKKKQTEQADFNTKVERFLEELKPTLSKYSIGIQSVPYITKEGKISAKIQFVDIKQDAKQPGKKSD